MAGKWWWVLFCLLLTHLNGCIGDVQIPGCHVVSDPDCSNIFNAHRKEASVFLDPDATKDDLDHAIDSIRRQYSDAENLYKSYTFLTYVYLTVIIKILKLANCSVNFYVYQYLLYRNEKIRKQTITQELEINAL